MQFKRFAVVVALVGGAYAARAPDHAAGPDNGAAPAQPQALTSTAVVTDLNTLTDLANQTVTVLHSITPSNALSIIAGLPKIFSNFEQIATTVLQDITTLGLQAIFSRSEMSPRQLGEELTRRQSVAIPVAGQAAICSAFQLFVQYYQLLMNTLVIDKAAVSAIATPLALVLRTVELGIETLSYGVISVVPSCSTLATAELGALNATFQQVLSAFPLVNTPVSSVPLPLSSIALPSFSLGSIAVPSASVGSISLPSVSVGSILPASISAGSVALPSISAGSVAVPSFSVGSLSVPSVSVAAPSASISVPSLSSARPL
ncbi:hypothetical protein BX600DRAFT_40658 [Xylariales sp. PMI_506]|nr:hypothetical protein BX600DRAFT_40658 [Xylariales sp. PMI_506]